jgi:hypothetical protein
LTAAWLCFVDEVKNFRLALFISVIKGGKYFSFDMKRNDFGRWKIVEPAPEWAKPLEAQLFLHYRPKYLIYFSFNLCLGYIYINSVQEVYNYPK